MKCKRVFILGIDAVGDGLKEVETPNINRVFDKGIYTYKAMAALPTISGECWGSILTGVMPEKHGLTNEIAETRQYPPDSPYPTIFRVAREKYPMAELASFSNWLPINTGIIEQGIGCRFTTGEDGELAAAVAGYLKDNDPLLLFLHLDGCDAAGHTHGYFTKAHYDAIEEADRLIGIVLDGIEAAGMLEDSAVIILTDHGGGGEHPRSHGSAQPKDSTVFWGCRAPFIKEAGREIEKPVHIADTAAFAAYCLGLEFPSELDGSTGFLQGLKTE